MKDDRRRRRKPRAVLLPHTNPRRFVVKHRPRFSKLTDYAELDFADYDQGHIVVDVYARQQQREHPQPFSRPLHTDKCRRSPFPRSECSASATVLQA
jgi:hypothetical protein